MKIWTEIKNLLTKSKTLDYNKIQYIGDGSRGIPVHLESGDCKKCKECVEICPTKAIEIIDKKGMAIDYGACLQCGLCAESCPEGVLVNSNFLHVYSFKRDNLKVVYTKDEILPNEELETENIKKFRKVTKGKGFHYREVAAGGNNSVEWELNASFNNVFDSEGQGFRCVASPKHADVLLFSGPVSKNMGPALEKAWDCMAEPKVLVACGTEAVSGGLFPKGDLSREPDLYIGGDPPRPDIVISAFRLISGRVKFHFQKALKERILELRKAKLEKFQKTDTLK